jgi:hypothetical protein
MRPPGSLFIGLGSLSHPEATYERPPLASPLPGPLQCFTLLLGGIIQKAVVNTLWLVWSVE